MKTPSLKLPDGWTVSLHNEKDEMGFDTVCLDAESADGSIEITLGQMPEDDTAEDEAFANYADMVGFDDDDDDDSDKIQCFMFNGKKAYGFSAVDEQEHPINVFCQEPQKGICVMYVVSAPDYKTLNGIMALIERGFRLTGCP